MRVWIVFFFLSVAVLSAAQQKYTDARLRVIADSILAEGNDLYLLEWGAWRSSDLLMENKDIVPGRDMSGYLSYMENGLSRTIFYIDMKTSVKVVADYGWGLQAEVPVFNSNEVRELTDLEMKLFRIKNSVWDYVMANSNVITFPPGCTLNMAILPGDVTSRVFLLPGVTESRLIPLGNDYEIRVDEACRVVDFKKIHQGYIPVSTDYGKAGQAVVGMHSHLESLPFISSTDICMLRLYGPLYGMDKHLVLSEYPAVFDIKANTLEFVMEDEMRALFSK